MAFDGKALSGDGTAHYRADIVHTDPDTYSWQLNVEQGGHWNKVFGFIYRRK